MKYLANIITHYNTTPSLQTAKGIWTMDEMAYYRSNNSWPRTTPVVSFKSSAEGTTSLTLPSGISAGDIIVVYNQAETSGGPAPVTPSGYTSIIDAGSGTNYRAIFSYKISTGSDSGATVTGMTQTPTIIALVFSTGKTDPIITVNSPVGSVSNSAPASRTVPSATGSVPLIVLGANRTETPGTIQMTWSPAEDASVPSPKAGRNVFYKIYSSSPADISISQSDGGFGNILVSFYLSVS